jgi:hypothetical protein
VHATAAPADCISAKAAFLCGKLGVLAVGEAIGEKNKKQHPGYLFSVDFVNTHICAPCATNGCPCSLHLATSSFAFLVR